MLQYFTKKARQLADNDSENLVKTRALEFLALHDQPASPDEFIEILKNIDSETEANLVLNTIALLTSVKDDFQIEISRDLVDKEWLSHPNRLVYRRLEFINNWD